MKRIKFPNFKKLFLRRNRWRLVRALESYLPSKEFKQLIEGCSDFRQLLAATAERLRITEIELAIAIASRIGIPYLNLVDPAPSLGNFSLNDCRRLGCIPLYTQGILSGIACVDPDKAQLLPGYNESIPLYLARWISIAGALEKSHVGNDMPQDSSGNDEKLALKALAIMTRETILGGADSMIVRLTRDTVTYSFTTPSGKSASGEVSHIVHEPIMAIFEKHAGRMPITLSADSNIESKFDVLLHSANAGGKSYLLRPYSPSRLDHIERVECFDASLSSRASSWEEVTQTVESQLILLVEDNAIFARVLEKFFLKQGIATFHCENGVTALEYLNQAINLPDLVLCDVHMPHMNGIELVKRLRSERRFDAMPIAIITSDDQTDTELRLLEEGADAFVSKSEDPRLLTVKVKRLLEKKGAKRAA